VPVTKASRHCPARRIATHESVASKAASKVGLLIGVHTNAAATGTPPPFGITTAAAEGVQHTRRLT